jgi:hypothetical protein
LRVFILYERNLTLKMIDIPANLPSKLDRLRIFANIEKLSLRGGLETKNFSSIKGQDS